MEEQIYLCAAAGYVYWKDQLKMNQDRTNSEMPKPAHSVRKNLQQRLMYSTPKKKIITKEAQTYDQGNRHGSNINEDEFGFDSEIPENNIEMKKKRRKKRREKSVIAKEAKRTKTAKKFAERISESNLTLARAYIPDSNIFLGFAKAKPHSLFTWLRNCRIAGHISEHKQKYLLEKYEEAENRALNTENSEKILSILYRRLSTATAFEEDGIARFEKVLNNFLQ